MTKVKTKTETKTGPTFEVEARYIKEGIAPIAGLDEAGRGPWAGPVLASAVILDPATAPPGLNDSKKLTEAKREMLFDIIMDCAHVGVGQASAQEIDTLGLGPANTLAMTRALTALPRAPAFVLVDGKFLPKLGYPAKAVIKGDGKCLSIAAASIIAKVTRDRIMRGLAKSHPEYGWESNKGYGTATHSQALKIHGVTQHHRRSFKPIHNMLR